MRTPNKVESILIEFFDKDDKTIMDIAIAWIKLATRLVNIGIIQSQQKISPDQKGEFKIGGIVPGDLPKINYNSGDPVTIPDIIPQEVFQSISNSEKNIKNLLLETKESE